MSHYFATDEHFHFAPKKILTAETRLSETKKVLAGKLNLKLMIISEHWGQKLAEIGSKESWTDMLRYVADERRLF